MKLKFVLPVLTLGLLMLPSQPAMAQDEDPRESVEPSKEDHEKEDAESEQKDKETTVKMMKVFKALEGEWKGKETVDYNNELPGMKNKPDMEWEDTWRGFYTQGGRYFEMEGETKGKLASTYRWMVTYDSGEETYRAWSFGSTGFSQYDGELSKDGKSVVWTHTNEMEAMDVKDTFEFRVDGNSCEASGETLLMSKDGENSQSYSEHKSTYTRKKVEI